MTTKVFYHRDEDGIASAYAYWVGNLGTVAIGEDDPNTEYASIQYGETIDIGTHSKLVFLDFTPPLESLIAWSKSPQVVEVEVTDHHRTAEAIWSYFNDMKHGLYWLQIGFDPGANGACELAWKRYGHGNLPWQLYHIGHRDVWDFTHPDTKGVCKYLQLAMPKIENAKECFKFFTDTRSLAEFAKAQQVGGLLVKNDEKYISGMAEKITYLYVVERESSKIHPMIGVNAAYMVSEIASEVLRHEKLVCVYCISDTGLQLSFRSTDNSAATVAKALGGGGHDNAAGVRLKDYEVTQTSMGVSIRVRNYV